MNTDDDDRTDPFGIRITSSRPRRPRGLERRVGLDRLFSVVLGEDGRPNESIRFGRFVADAKCGEGGMGQLFRGHDEETGRLVAIKLGVRAGGGEIARLRREAKRLRSLSHPGIVRYLDDGVTADGCHFLVMTWLEGCDLGRWLRHEGPLTPVEARAVGLALADALASAHEAGVIHRDIKPANVFLVDRRPQEIRLLDFGIARTATGDDTDVTGANMLVGTPSCMAPEQIEGSWSERTDVYGLGGTLYEALTGVPLFDGDNPTRVAIDVLETPPPRVRDSVPTIDPRLDDLVFRMVAKDPVDRPRSMRAVITALTAVV